MSVTQPEQTTLGVLWKLWTFQVSLSKVNFSKVYFSQVYFGKVYFSKVIFSKVYFGEVKVCLTHLLIHWTLHRFLLLHLHQRQRDNQQFCGRLLWHEENCLWCYLQESGYHFCHPHHQCSLHHRHLNDIIDISSWLQLFIWQECNSTECRIPLSFMSEEHLVLEVSFCFNCEGCLKYKMIQLQILSN